VQQSLHCYIGVSFKVTFRIDVKNDVRNWKQAHHKENQVKSMNKAAVRLPVNNYITVFVK